MGFDILKYKETYELKRFYQRLWEDQHVPFCIKRNDGALMLMNNDFKTYSFWKKANGEPWNAICDECSLLKFSYRRLFEDARVSEGDFIVESWAPIENLFNNPEQYFTQKSQMVVNYRINVRNTKQSKEKLQDTIER